MDKYQNFQLPSIDLLEQNVHSVNLSDEEIAEKIDIIKKTFEEANIGVKEIKVHPSSAVSLYEVVPQRGPKLVLLRDWKENLPWALQSLNASIVTNFSYRGTIGIEIPNKMSKSISFYNLLKSSKLLEAGMELPIGIGVSTDNMPFTCDLNELKRLLICGGTAQGKTMLLNIIITSLLLSKKPDQLKLMLFDPKKKAFSLYNRIKDQYLFKSENSEREVIVKWNKFKPGLKLLVKEMYRRLHLIERARVYDLKEYNDLCQNMTENEKKRERLPYIVVVIDEYADMISLAGKKVETYILRLSRMGSWLGINIIMATQCPTCDIISGRIKTDFQNRICFRVNSDVESRIILDRSGAESLIGPGDMLIQHKVTQLKRVQGAYITDSEIEAVCNYISAQ